jgi:hypothetical protein
MWLLLVLLIAGVGLVVGWRMAVSTWGVETPRQAAEAAWYRLNPPRAVSVGVLQRRIMRAAVGARVVSVRGTSLVPSTFEVRLNPEDLDTIGGVQTWIATELAGALEDRAGAEGWELQGHPVVVFTADPAKVPGRPQVRARHESRTVDLDRPGQPIGDVAPSAPVGWLRPLGDEDPVALTAGVPIVLGRGSTASVDLADASISRRHCELRPTVGGWVVEDLGSANGTKVNGVVADRALPLRPGDVLALANAVQFVAEALDPATQPARETGPMPPTRVVSGDPA